MTTGDGWMWRPVLFGMCSAESLYGTELSLEHFSAMNEALDVRFENEHRQSPPPKGK